MHLQNDNSFDRRNVMLMLFSVVLFATNTLLVRAVAIHAPAANGWVAIVFRGAVGMIVVWSLFGWGRGLVASRLFSNGLVLTRGVIGALATIAFYVTIVKLGAARAVILNLTYPIFATLIAAVWLKEKISRPALVWMLIGFLGLVVFLSDAGNLRHPSGYDLIALAGALGAGWVVVIIRRLRHEEHPATIYASQAVFSLLIAAPTAGHVMELPAFAWWGLIGGAVVVTAAQLIMTRAYQFMSVSRGSSLQMLLPVVTALGGFLCFGESFHPLEIAGALLTIFATWRVVTGR